MRGELFSREGGRPSHAASADAPSGDGPLPAQGHCHFATIARNLAGLLPATFGWTAEQFWKSTPAELVAIFAVFSEHARGHLAQVPLDTEQLEQLKETFPDG